MSDSTTIPSELNAQSLSSRNDTFVSKELSEVLSRTHDAAGDIVDLKDIEGQEVGLRAFFLGSVGSVLGWFPKDASPKDVQNFAAIVDAMTRGRNRLAEAANDSVFEKKEVA